jgi:NADPH-dependent ferric siderophore reductase
MQRQDTPAHSPRAAVDFPLPSRLLGIAGVQPLELEVAEVADLGPHMRRVRLVGAALADFSYQPGQDIMLVLGGTPDRPLSRRYSIRTVDRPARMLELNIVVHGVHGPGAEWAAAALPGDRVSGVGPRGKIFVDPDAEWHVFLGDESAAPALLIMIEALPAGVAGRAYLEVAAEADQLATAGLAGQHQINRLHRGELPPTASSLLEQALDSAEFPRGHGHVYIFGEVQRIAGLQRAALARGLAPDQLSIKAYWGRNKANADRGEPDA